MENYNSAILEIDKNENYKNETLKRKYLKNPLKLEVGGQYKDVKMRIIYVNGTFSNVFTYVFQKIFNESANGLAWCKVERNVGYDITCYYKTSNAKFAQIYYDSLEIAMWCTRNYVEDALDTLEEPTNKLSEKTII